MYPRYTVDPVDNQIKVDNMESEEEIEQVLMDQPKTVEVLQIFRKIKTLVTTSTDAELIQSYDYIYQKVQEMSIKEKMQTRIEKYFKCVVFMYWYYLLRLIKSILQVIL